VFISLPVAELTFRTKPNPSEIYLRANVNKVAQVSNLLGPTADPQNPSGVQVSRPSDALEARAAAKGQFTTLLLGLGAVALLVGAIGIANIMVISVLERRGEIGLRRSLGATRRHISTQFLTESAVLAVLGAVAGLIIGAGATEIYAQAKHEPFVVPLYALIASPAAGFAIGSLAGLYPATKAARLSPTEALRT
jgi:putative ABC transport system permease protein